MYSQYDEQHYILKACRHQSKGRFLDIGAWHATEFSNTRALYECGWSGVLIEPSPGPMMGLLKEYGNDERITLLQAAVGIEASMVTLHVTDDAVTTSSEAEYDRWKDTAKFYGNLVVPTVTLHDLSNRYGGFDFVNIDAEGISVDLLLELLRLDMQPACICVEADNRDAEIIAAATPRHYMVVYGNGTNLVLVRS